MGLSEGLATFERELIARVPAWLSRIDSSSAFVDEVRQLVREKLFVDGKIREYSGLGALALWLKMVVVRTALNLKRSRGERRSGVEPIDAAGRALPGQVDPELDYLKARYATDFKTAFTQALESLTSEQRNLLRLYFVDGRTTAQIGALFHVNQSTAVRRLAQARQSLRKRSRAILSERLGLAPGELDSIAKLVHSQLDLSLTRLLMAPVK
jgi:RNA polymerase sigma-70 factor (ECF subfamily)